MDLCSTILPIIKEASKIMLEASNPDEANGISKKTGDANFVTKYDRATQDYLIKRISEAIPDAIFVAEEQENDFASLEAPHVFIIDPIDGTTNFIHSFSHSSISVACLSSGTTVFGAVYDPYLDEMFYATRGGGAFKNGQPISVSDRDLKSAITIFGSSPYYKDELGKAGFDLAYRLFFETLDVRRLASAALDLCYIACGRAEVFFELRLSPWDYAAGELILKEAGGKISRLDGSETDLSAPNSVFAANSVCHKDLLRIAREGLS